MTTRDRTPRCPHCAATSVTAASGTAITATSTCSGRSVTDARQCRPSSELARGLTGYTSPGNPPVTMLCRISRPTVPRRRLAPTTATDAGRSRCRRLATAAWLSLAATESR